MLALRVICLPALTPVMLDVLRDDPGATHVVALPGAAVEVAGDLLMVDVAREAASALVASLWAVPGGRDCAYALGSDEATL